MHAAVDSYSQATIELEPEEVTRLITDGVYEGNIPVIPRKVELPLTIRVKETGWRGEALPLKALHENKTSYEIDIPPDGPERMLNGIVIGSQFPTIWMRKIYMGTKKGLLYG